MSVINSKYFELNPSLMTDKEFVHVAWYAVSPAMRRAVLVVQHEIALYINTNYDRIQACR